jgi:hypothetical protein
MSAIDPVLKNQGVYSTTGGVDGPNLISSDWEVISTSISANSTSYTDNSVNPATYYKYAIIHRDYAYNYSTSLVSNSVLPVTFQLFSAVKNLKFTNLSWTTGTEQNNSGFAIQRSVDGTNFEQIGFVKSLSPNGNSSSRLDYSFTDYSPVGIRQYYRLKQTDLDGTSKYSAVVMVTREAPTSLELTHVYPNPSHESLYINAASPQKMDLMLLVFDLSGRVVGKKQVSAEIGNNGFDIPVAHLAPGPYILKVFNPNQKVLATEKFIKQ